MKRRPRIEVVGFTWYRQEHYDRMKAMFDDSAKVPASFDDWLAAAEGLRAQLFCEGFVVKKAYLDPEVFPKWCVAQGRNLDAEARTEYARECAARAIERKPIS